MSILFSTYQPLLSKKHMTFRLREGIQRPLRGHGPPPQQALGRVQQHVAQGPRLPGKRERLGAGPCVGKSGKSVIDEIWEHRNSGKFIYVKL